MTTFEPTPAGIRSGKRILVRGRRSEAGDCRNDLAAEDFQGGDGMRGPPSYTMARPTLGWVTQNGPQATFGLSAFRHAGCVMAYSGSPAKRASAVREVGALSDLNDISVRIADVTARLAVFGDRLRDELRSSTFP
jgi:hypothetical protein